MMQITNQNEKDLFNILSYKIEVPLKSSSRLLKSKIGEVFLKRLSKIIHPNKLPAPEKPRFGKELNILKNQLTDQFQNALGNKSENSASIFIQFL